MTKGQSEIDDAFDKLIGWLNFPCTQYTKTNFNIIISTLTLVGKKEKVKIDVSEDISLDDILPYDLSYYTYHGSLTTPPCYETVQWIMMRCPIRVSGEVRYMYPWQYIMVSLALLIFCNKCVIHSYLMKTQDHKIKYNCSRLKYVTPYTILKSYFYFELIATHSHVLTTNVKCQSRSVPKTFTCSMNNTKPSSFVPLLRITYNSTCNTQFILCWWLPLQKVTERYFTIKTDCNPNKTSRSVVCLTSTLSVNIQ